MSAAPGNVAVQVFTPHTRGDDGFTTPIWREDAAMASAAYRPGSHRERINRHARAPMADRSSFSRSRAIRTAGSWNDADPVKRAAQGPRLPR